MTSDNSENNYPPQSIYPPRPSTDPASTTHSDPCSSSSAMSHSESSSHLQAAHHGQSSSTTSWTHLEPPSEDYKAGESVELGKVDELDGERIGKRLRTEELPPSPPLTRTGTNGSTGHEAEGAPPIQVEEVEDVEEADIVQGWHPLAHEGSRSRDEDEEDSGSVHLREDSIQDDQASEVDEIPRRLKESPRVEHLRMEFKAPSPQPWDLVDPLPDNIDPLTSDYYSTLQSKNFATLQKNRRRPLIPHSSYYFGPPQPDAAYGTPPVGQIGVHHPREIVRIERDYAGGELIQFSPIYPLELEGRITATQFLEMINDINEILISAHSIRHSFLFNFLAVFTLQLSTLVLTSHYTKEMRRLEQKIEELNTQIYNPVGLNILSPRKVAFLFLEIEYY